MFNSMAIFNVSMILKLQICENCIVNVNFLRVTSRTSEYYEGGLFLNECKVQRVFIKHTSVSNMKKISQIVLRWKASKNITTYWVL